MVQVTSVAALGTAPGFGPYCAAKHALEGLSECLAKEVAPFGIRVHRVRRDCNAGSVP